MIATPPSSGNSPSSSTHISSPRRNSGGNRLTREIGNVRAALAYLRERAAERYLDLVGALGYFWWGRSHVIEGREHVNAVMAMVSPQPVRRSYLRALRGKGMLWAFEGGQTGARELMLEALAWSRELGDPLEIAASLETLGWSQFLANEAEDSCATFRERRTLWLNDYCRASSARRTSSVCAR